MFLCWKGKNSGKGKKALQVFKRVQVKSDSSKKTLKNSFKGFERFNTNQPLTSVPMNTNKFDFSKVNRGVLKDHNKRTIVKSGYDQLIEEFASSSKQWTDLDFPPFENSWGGPKQNLIWKRIRNVYPNIKFIENSFSQSDIIQNKKGKNYFSSAISALANNPDRIVSLFPNIQINKNGIYMARILHKGVYQQVLVDDYFPFNTTGQLLCSPLAGGKQIWPIILQKCLAKLYGSYSAIEGIHPNQVLRAFSSAPTYHYKVKEQTIQKQIDYTQMLWKRIMKANEEGNVICSATAQEEQKIYSKTGLLSDHAYSIIGVYEQPCKLLKIRSLKNIQWKGSINSKYQQFWNSVSSKLKQNIGYFPGDTSTFFIKWQDFLQYFVSIDICKISKLANYLFVQDTFKPMIPAYFQVYSLGGEMTIACSQKDYRERAQQTKQQFPYLSNITLIVSKINNQTQRTQFIDAISNQFYSDLYLKLTNLDQGKYIICCIVDEVQNCNQNCTISLYSHSNVTLENSQIKGFQYLQRIFMDHAVNNANKYILNQSPSEWWCSHFFKKGKIGYNAYHMDSKSTFYLQVSIIQGQFQDNMLELMDKYKSRGNFKITCDRGKQQIIIYRFVAPMALDSDCKVHVPAPKVNKKLK